MSPVSVSYFQLVIGLFLAFTAIRGKGSLYRFNDIPEEKQDLVHKVLRIVYGVCGAAALIESGLCIWFDLDPNMGVPASVISNISFIGSAVLIILLMGTFIWLRRNANKDN